VVLDIAHEVGLLPAGLLPAGDYADAWYGRDDRGRRVASGVYFYCLVAGSTVITRKMTLLK